MSEQSLSPLHMEAWEAFLTTVLIPECRKRGYRVEFESVAAATCTIVAKPLREEVPMEQLSFLPDDEHTRPHHYYQD